MRRTSAPSRWPLLTLLTLLLAPGAAAQTVELELPAAPAPGLPVEAPVPAALASAAHIRLVAPRGAGVSELPAQRLPGEPGSLVWIAPDAGRSYRLEAAESAPATPPGPRADVREEAGEWVFRSGERELARYRAAVVAPPDGVDAFYARSGYLHPLRTPSGRAVTGDFPPAHRHHHGVWSAWTRARFEGHAVDFWNSAERQGRVEHARVLGHGGGPVCAWLRVELRHVDLTAPEEPRVALLETWELRAWNLPGATLIDLATEQRCAGEAPLELLEYHYGGVGFRAPVGWEEERGRFLTSEGKDRLEGHATRPRWCAVTGEVEEAPVTMLLVCDPASYRAPQPVRLHPSEPFFCWAPCQLGPFSIASGEPFRARYRFAALDGPPDPARCETLATF
jgi:hypothetical protein